MKRKDLTPRQWTVLDSLEFGSYTAKTLGVRSDVLWRLEERGLVSRNAYMEPRWRITSKGRELLYERDGYTKEDT